jgi:hypothetical protein
LSHFECSRGRQVRESTIVRGGGGLDDYICDICRTASAITGSLVMCSGLTNKGNVNGVKTSSLHPRLNLHLNIKYGYKVWIAT